MAFGFELLALILAQTSGQPSNACSSYVGQRVTTTTFDAVRAGLPSVAARGAYESTAEYERRLAAAQTSSAPMIIRRSGRRIGLTYNADRRELTVYDMAFGAGRLNYSDILGRSGLRSSDDNYSNAIGFVIDEIETGRRTFEATNGFGARTMVERIEGRINAVWEKPGRLNQSPFVDVRPFRPVAVLRMEPAAARDVIEEGASAMMVVPRAPYIRTGQDVLEATYNRPRERLNTVTVLIADIHCGFLLDGQGGVVLALSVR